MLLSYYWSISVLCHFVYDHSITASFISLLYRTFNFVTFGRTSCSLLTKFTAARHIMYNSQIFTRSTRSGKSYAEFCPDGEVRVENVRHDNDTLVVSKTVKKRTAVNESFKPNNLSNVKVYKCFLFCLLFL